jgi:hypothetical protein
VKRKPEGGSRGDRALLTLSEFVKLARDRGRELNTVKLENGAVIVSDGSKLYVLAEPLRGELLPSRFVAAMCDLFDLPAADFALDRSPGPLDDG